MKNYQLVMDNLENTEHDLETAFLPGHVQIPSRPRCCGRFQYFYHKFRFCMCINTPSLLIKSQWKIPISIWITYRVIMAILACATLASPDIYIFIKDYCLGAHIFIFFTQWSLLILSVTFILQALLVIVYRSYLTMESIDIGYIKVPWPMIIMWILMNINFTIALGIAVIFWTILNRRGVDHPLFWLAFLQHGVTAILVFIDLCMIALPVRWSHFYQPSIFGLIYLVFTFCIFELSEERFFSDESTIYGFLNWSKPLRTFLSCVLGGIVIISIIQCIVSLICFLRKKIAKHICNRMTH